MSYILGKVTCRRSTVVNLLMQCQEVKRRFPNYRQVTIRTQNSVSTWKMPVSDPMEVTRRKLLWEYQLPGISVTEHTKLWQLINTAGCFS